MIRIGISGWRYEPWRGVFYPEGLAQRRELEFAARHFPSVEINGSFYSLQRPEYYQAWHDETPPGFVFAVKGSRYITHMLRLNNIERPLANFYASGILNLRDKLGPFLWQFPPMFAFRPEKLAPFFELLPRSTQAALSLARRRDARMLGRSRLAIDADRPLRHAMEVRHESFVSKDFVRLLQKHDIGLVVADTAGKWPKLFEVTSDFVYVRLHGDVKIYTSGYTPRALDEWARRIRAWSRAGKDVYVYFDNDVKVHAPFDALQLMRRLGLAWEPEGVPGEVPVRLHRPGARRPRLRAAYGPRVTGGNPAWDALRTS
ncbi:MAG: DUF72 domain-containing protein [Betaproteobacteria bacterium]